MKIESYVVFLASIILYDGVLHKRIHSVTVTQYMQTPGISNTCHMIYVTYIEKQHQPSHFSVDGPCTVKLIDETHLYRPFFIICLE